MRIANIENFADAFVRPLHLPFPILLSYVAAFSEVVGDKKEGSGKIGCSSDDKGAGCCRRRHSTSDTCHGFGQLFNAIIQIIQIIESAPGAGTPDKRLVVHLAMSDEHRAILRSLRSMRDVMQYHVRTYLATICAHIGPCLLKVHKLFGIFVRDLRMQY